MAINNHDIMEEGLILNLLSDIKGDFQSIANHIAKFAPEMIAIRQDLHAHPELGFEEYRTSDIVANLLTEWGYEVTRNLGKTGLVGQLKVGNGSKKIGLRADMDALPIQEETGLAYASKNAGKMHACGHDGHTASLLAAARYLAETRNFSGTVNLIFQPAEEGLSGAQAMIDDGLFDKFPCDYLFSFHNDPNIEGKKFSFISGPALSSSDTAIINIKGQGGHGSKPFKTIDPVVVGSSIVMALQTIVARNVDPREMAVITVGSFRSGTAPNVIPDSAELQLTIRAYSPEVRELLKDKIHEISQQQAKSYGAEVEIDYQWRYPSLLNDIDATKYASELAVRVLGAENVITDDIGETASDDLAMMLNIVPGCYVFVGLDSKAESVHTSKYNFNDDILPLVATYWGALVEDFLKA